MAVVAVIICAVNVPQKADPGFLVFWSARKQLSALLESISCEYYSNNFELYQSPAFTPMLPR
jgi:hypothetical protein